ncbi:MAG: GspH/FimT family protein [Gammaproteobacteria bacterium]|nr:GspH/FimT family protein [Gammaproteobacteria bacterium]
MAKKIKAFTIIELMTVVALVAIVAAIAVPSLRNFILDNKLAAFSNDFVASVSMAKGEAISNRERVLITSINNDWANGWKIVVDSNGDGDFNDAEDEEVRTVSLESGLKLKGTPNDMTINSNGIISGLNWGSITVCDDRGKGRTVTVVGAGITSIDKEPACG